MKGSKEKKRRKNIIIIKREKWGKGKNKQTRAANPKHYPDHVMN